MAKAFTEENFQSDVLDAELPVLVDFWAPWCGPCQAMGPVVDELAQELDGKVIVGKMNVDEASETPGKYGVMSIPNFVLFKGGKVVDQQVGGVGKEALLNMVNEHLA